MVILQELKKILTLLKIITVKHIHEDLDEVHKIVEKTSGKIDKLLYVTNGAGLLAAVLAFVKSQAQ
jgi:hypothetical protein